MSKKRYKSITVKQEVYDQLLKRLNEQYVESEKLRAIAERITKVPEQVRAYTL